MIKDIIHVGVTLSIIALTSVGGNFAYARQQTNFEALASAEEARVMNELTALASTVEGPEVLVETTPIVELPAPEPVIVKAPVKATANEPTAAELQALADAKAAARVSAAALVAEQEKQLQLQKIADAKAAQIAADKLAARLAAEEAAALAAKRTLAKQQTRRSQAS